MAAYMACCNLWPSWTQLMYSGAPTAQLVVMAAAVQRVLDLKRLLQEPFKCICFVCRGVLIGSAVFPIASCLMWSRCTALGAISGALIGQWSGVTFWLLWAKVILLLIFFAPLSEPHHVQTAVELGQKWAESADAILLSMVAVAFRKMWTIQKCHISERTTWLCLDAVILPHSSTPNKGHSHTVVQLSFYVV